MVLFHQFFRISLLVWLLASVAGCQTRIPGTSIPVNPLEVVDYNQDYLVIKSRYNDSYAAIAERYYGSSSEAFRIQHINPVLEEGAGQWVVLPLKNLNPSGVYPGYYKTIPVLCYHQFTGASKSSHPLILREQKFRNQMQYLKDNGYQVLQLEELELYLSGERPIPDRSVILTIDDGYRSIYETAYPVLQEFNFPATVFLYTDFVGGGAALTWEQIEEIQQGGLINFQSHSKTHSSLATVDKPDQDTVESIRTEVRQPKDRIQDKLGFSPVHFAYPYGDSSDTAVEILKQEGFQLALTVQAGGNPTFADPMRLRRAMIYDSDTLSTFKLKLTNQEQFRQ